MRLSTFTLFLSTLAIFSCFLAPVSSIHPHALARQREHNRSPVPQVLSSRQYRIARDLLDVCIDINVDLLANATQLLGLQSLLGPLNLDGNIQLCLCLKDLDIYLETNDDIQALVGLLGSNTVRALITALINTSPEAQQCAFPRHAHHVCSTADPCHYECDHPYVRKGGVCVCAAPHTSCNGICGYFPQGCGSAAPVPLERRSNPILTIAQAKASCKPHETVCGIPGTEKPGAFECIDISSAKDSCGGCVTPHPFFERDPVRGSSGKDCSTIPKSKTVSCSAQRCVVRTCIDGWLPNSDGTGCDAIIPPSKMLKVRRLLALGDGSSPEPDTSEQNIPASSSVNATVSISTDLTTQVHTLLGLVVELGNSIHSASVPALNSSIDSSLLSNMEQAAVDLVQSSTLLSLHDSLEVLYTSECAVRDALVACGCISDLALEPVLAKLWLAIEATLALLTSCDGDIRGLSSATTAIVDKPTGSSQSVHVGGPTVGRPTTTLLSISVGVGLSGTLSLAQTTSHVLPFLTPGPTHSTYSSHVSAPTAPPKPSTLSDIPIVVGLNTVLSSLGLGSIEGVATVDGLLGNDANNAVNNILDGLDIGPHDLLAGAGLEDVKAVAVANGLLSDGLDKELDDSLDGLDIGPHNAVRSVAGSQASEDVPLVTSVNRLLSDLGLGNVEAVAVADGLLGNGLDTSLDNTLDGLDIGPHDIKRGASLQDWHAQPPIASNTTADFKSSLDALIDNVLELHGIKSLLPPVISALGLPPIASLPACSSSNLTQCFIDNLIAATILTLSSPTSSDLLNNMDQLSSASLASVDALDRCSCVENDGLENVYNCLVDIMHSTTALTSLCHSQTEILCTPNPSVSGTSDFTSNGVGEPLIIGLRKLLNGLGIDAGPTNIVISNILGNGLDNSLNSILNSLNIGPNGQRR